MLKKWGPALLIAIALSGLLVWTQCVEPPVEVHSSVTEQELRAIAVAAVGEPEWIIPRPAFPKFEAYASLSKEAQELVDIGADLEAIRSKATKRTVAEFWPALVEHKDIGSGPPIETVRFFVGMITGEVALGQIDRAVSHIDFADKIITGVLQRARSSENWKEASAARSLFVESVAKLASDSALSLANRQAIAIALTQGEHRESLGKSVKSTLIETTAKSLELASTRDDLDNIAVEGLFEDPTDDEAALVSALLYRHRRAFSPIQTMASMSQSVKSLIESIRKPWSESERVLDLVTESQSIWIGFEEVLQLDDLSATAAIKSLKAKVDSTENPVGLALLNRERLSWSNDVQSAYVADAKEAMARIAILKGTKGFDPSAILDPLTGRPFDLTGDTPKTTLKQAGEKYAFVRAFAEIDKSPTRQ